MYCKSLWIKASAKCINVNVLGEGKQLIKKMDSIGSQQFNVPKALCHEC